LGWGEKRHECQKKNQKKTAKLHDQLSLPEPLDTAKLPLVSITSGIFPTINSGLLKYLHHAADEFLG